MYFTKQKERKQRTVPTESEELIYLYKLTDFVFHDQENNWLLKDGILKRHSANLRHLYNSYFKYLWSSKQSVSLISQVICYLPHTMILSLTITQMFLQSWNIFMRTSVIFFISIIKKIHVKENNLCLIFVFE